MNTPLQIRNLSKFYGKLKAVDQVNFEIQSGEVFGLLGPNGAGKTSIISIITTLEKPTDGEVLVFGKNIITESKFTKAQIGVVHQEVINSGFFSIQEILKFHSGLYGLLKNSERIDYILHRLNLYEHRNKKVKQLSGGMKRRLMIAKALVHNPQLILLDEPTAGVDITLRHNLWSLVEELKKEKKAILLTTHYLEEAESICDRVAILNKGKLECMGPTHEIIEKFTQRDVQLTLKAKMQFDSEYYVSENQYEYNFVIPHHLTLGDFLQSLHINLDNIVDIKINDGTLEAAFNRVLSDHKDGLQ